MKKMKVTILSTAMLVLFSFMLMSFIQEKKAWDVPAKYMSMKNPQKAGDADMVKLGKMTYAKHCKACHGNLGKGDGPKAKSLGTPDLGDFTSAEFKAEKDGVVYYQSFVGRGDMPNFEKKIIDEEERWALITFLRTLK